MPLRWRVMWESSSQQVDTAVKKATQLPCVISRLLYRLTQVIYISVWCIFRLHFECSVQTCVSNLGHDVDKLERVQRLATWMISWCHLVPYEECLVRLDRFAPQRRCPCSDLISTFRIVNGFDHMYVTHLFEFMPPNNSWGHDRRAVNKGARLAIRANAYSQRSWMPGIGFQSMWFTFHHLTPSKDQLIRYEFFMVRKLGFK